MAKIRMDNQIANFNTGPYGDPLFIPPQKDKHKDRGKSSRKHSAPSKHSSSSSSTQNPSSSGSTQNSSLERMRAERIARERQEQMKTQALLRKNDCVSGKKRREDTTSSDDSEDEARKTTHGKRRYNSQYNPEFVPEAKKSRRDRYF